MKVSILLLLFLVSCTKVEKVYVETPPVIVNVDTLFAKWHISINEKDTAKFGLYIRYIGNDQMGGGGFYLRKGILSSLQDSITDFKKFASVMVNKSKHYAFQIVLIAYDSYDHTRRGRYHTFDEKTNRVKFKNSLNRNVLLVRSYTGIYERPLRFYDELNQSVVSIQPGDTLASEIIRLF